MVSNWSTSSLLMNNGIPPPYLRSLIVLAAQNNTNTSTITVFINP